MPNPDVIFEQTCRQGKSAVGAVSETVLAGASRPQLSGNRSQRKTSLVGILKHQVAGLLTSHAGRASLAGLQADNGGDDLERLAGETTSIFNKAPTIVTRNSGPGQP